MMRILTVRQPWAWAIIHGGKDVENRARNIAGAYRGPVAIHVALTPAEFPTGNTPPHMEPLGEMMRRNRDIVADYERWPWHQNQGAIIGVVDLADVHRWADCLEGVVGCSPWAQSDAHHLALANPRALAEPIPFKGALGLRALDDDMVAQVLGGIG